ncbi:hypothetical protein PVK06_039291 [Gossypium arboreum]|uniref:Reverse transcriptase n=1 Tax=Gossypium arboreum TaxID=29729 RepID=A0ABR0N2P9_GOSAR|nr:hypothetical protein PVK06_039291 [Gossypium arboreum]
MRCVCSISYTVVLNGEMSVWFEPSRGLRQGDPLSPYLFLICAEGFSMLLHEVKQNDLMRGAPIGRGKFSVNHLNKFLHTDWIILVMRCVCSVSYMVGLNGEMSVWFEPSRGLRQGDPLSPYLFLICAKGFSTLLHEVEQNDLIRGTPIGRGKFSVNHLFFADDCILFGDASKEGANMVRSVISEYEQASGQRVNFDKSLIYFGANVDSNVKKLVKSVLGVRVASNPEKYLGLPMMVGRKKRWVLAHFVDRFRKRMDGCGLRYLSIGGKEVFIKSVLQAIPVYVMQCFALPKMLCRKLEGLLNKFWWSNNKTTKGVHWSNWNALCKPKWAGEVLFSLFDDDRMNRILSILLACHRTHDTLVWKYEATRDYSVKSGYRVLITEQLQFNDFNSITIAKYKEFYQLLWDLHILAKIKIHMWRLFNNYVPHYTNLVQSRLFVQVDCPLCNVDPEDSDHLMWTCGILQQLWAFLNIRLITNGNTSSCKNRFVNTFLVADSNTRQDLIGFIRGYIQEISLCQMKLAVSSNTTIHHLWHPPENGMIKLNFDASFQKESKISCAAVLARNSDGHCLGAYTYPLDDVVDAFVAEARACERAMVFAAEMGFMRVLLEGDSLTIIKKLNSDGEDRSVLGPIINSIHVMERQFENVSYLFVPRAVDRAAHALVMEGRHCMSPCIWFHDPLKSVRMVLAADWKAWIQRS